MRNLFDRMKEILKAHIVPAPLQCPICWHIDVSFYRTTEFTSFLTFEKLLNYSYYFF